MSSSTSGTHECSIKKYATMQNTYSYRNRITNVSKLIFKLVLNWSHASVTIDYS